MPFMSAITTRFDGIDCHISRSGYTGEDGYEISCKATRVRAIVERLLSEPSVKLIGLGARDSLRLEAGPLPLRPRHRHDDVAGRGRARLVDPASGGARRAAFPAPSGCSARLREGAGAQARRHQAGRPRAGARGHRDPLGRRRDRSARSRRAASGRASTARSRWAMSRRKFAAPGTPVALIVRGKPLPASVVALPFVPHRYVRI